MHLIDAAVLDIIETCAAKCRRCPSNLELRAACLPERQRIDQAMNRLARRGHIRTLVFAKNWRQVEIISGPKAGLATAPPPFESDGPYLIVDRRGRHRNGAALPMKNGPLPQAKRFGRARRPDAGLKAGALPAVPAFRPPKATATTVPVAVAAPVPSAPIMPRFTDDPRAIADHGSPRTWP